MVEPAALILAVVLASTDDEPARKLPPVTTVCRGSAPLRCWTEPGESRCDHGEVFRIVIDEPGRHDVTDALAECRQPPPAK